MKTNKENFKEFKWMGFKSHMMATLAQWRDENYGTDATFQCTDGQVSAHRLILAAASPLLKEVMSQDDQVVIFLPEVSSKVMKSILDLVYKGVNCVKIKLFLLLVVKDIF